MSESLGRPGISRRTLLTGGASAFIGAGLVGRSLLSAPSAQAQAGPAPAPAPVTGTPYSSGKRVDVHLAATDGWVSMPDGSRADKPFFPDGLAPAPFDTYVFGFRDVTGLSANQVIAQRGKAQISAPLLAFDEGDDIYITLTNLGLSVRPDLTDGHTLHWHGFNNAIPLFDGVPELSISVPIGRDFTYFYRPHEPGTYMYHCHFEDVEHVQMGMTGLVYVRPRQNGNTSLYKSGLYAYNDGDGSTGYDREYPVFLSEIWSAAHYRDAHIQVSNWTDYAVSFWLMNGRAYPDTLKAPGSRGATGQMVAPAGQPRLQYQPHSSAITAKVGERVLLRVANLGYQNHSMTCDGIDLTVVAKDTNLLVGRDGSKNYITSNTVDLGPGEARDVIFTAEQPGTFLFYDRDYAYGSNGGSAGRGGQMTTIVISA